ncbi:MAG: macro domain-containing protein [Bacilli bacterium]|nr:macro domain-containing protein [Bacilli bacterium]
MEKKDYLISYLREKTGTSFPQYCKEDEIRALMNIALPMGFSDEFYEKQDEYLKELLSKKSVTDVSSLNYEGQMAIYRGDITLLKADAIVNAGNPALLGCFGPLHYCIDNAIHSYAGLEVRRDIMGILQGKEVETAEVVVTKGYNLPSTYIFHTVGPIYSGLPRDKMLLSACYTRCLAKADEMGLDNIVFCSLSTGVYGYPIEKASRVAINAAKGYLRSSGSKIKVVFDLFSEKDKSIYERAIGEDQGIA